MLPAARALRVAGRPMAAGGNVGQVQIKTAAGNGLSPAVTLDATPTNGNTLVCVLWINESTASTVGFPSGFTLRGSAEKNVGDISVQVADKTASGEGTTYTGSNSIGRGWVMTVIERDDLTGYQSSGNAQGDAVGSLNASASPTTAAWVLAAVGIQSDAVTVSSWSDSFTELVAHATGTGDFGSRTARGTAASRTVASSGTYGTTATFSAAIEAAMIVAAWGQS
jgi:hypothetical protein